MKYISQSLFARPTKASSKKTDISAKCFLNPQHCSGFKEAYYCNGSECVRDDKHGVGYYDGDDVNGDGDDVKVGDGDGDSFGDGDGDDDNGDGDDVRCVTVMMTRSMSSRWYQWQVFAGWGKPGKQSQRFV